MLLASACTYRPSHILSKKKMAAVLYDLHRTDGIVLLKGVTYNKDEELKKYYEATLLKHGVTQAQFDSSLVWYTDNPKRFNKIYPIVIKHLQEDADSYAWLDNLVRKPKLSAKDIPPYNFDSLQRTFTDGLKMQFSIEALDSLAADTALMYIFPLDSIDVLSVAARQDTIIGE